MIVHITFYSWCFHKCHPLQVQAVQKGWDSLFLESLTMNGVRWHMAIYMDQGHHTERSSSPCCEWKYSPYHFLRSIKPLIHVAFDNLIIANANTLHIQIWVISLTVLCTNLKLFTCWTTELPISTTVVGVSKIYS